MLRNFTRCALVLGLAALATSARAADVTGKWTMAYKVQDTERKQPMELKQEGEKLTGTVVGRNDQKTEIKDGTVKGNDVAFSITREVQGQQLKSLYKGKVDGDTMKGTFSINFGGQERTIDWTATRVK